MHSDPPPVQLVSPEITHGFHSVLPEFMNPTALSVAPFCPPGTIETNLWGAALRRLDKKDKIFFTPGLTDNKSCKELLEDVLKATKQRKEQFENKKIRISFAGKEIHLREVLGNLIKWVNHFVSIGDTIVQYDPGHAALPWAAVRFILLVSVKEESIYASTLAGVERVANITSRCAILEQSYLSSKLDIVEQLRESLIALYAEVLSFLSQSVRYFDSSNFKRYAKAVLTQTIETRLSSVMEKEKEVEKNHAMALSESAFKRDIDSRKRDEHLQNILANISHPRSDKSDQINISVHQLGVQNQLDPQRQLRVQNHLLEKQSQLQEVQIQLQDVETQLQDKQIQLAEQTRLVKQTKLLGLQKELGAKMTNIQRGLKSSEDKRILESISEVPYRSHHIDISKHRLPGSGEWLFNKVEFQTWRGNLSSSIFWVCGFPGSGKTTLASLVVDKLQTENVAFFYCSRNPAEPQRAMVRPILANSCPVPPKERFTHLFGHDI
ncbi:hypothetical protein HDK77DRAFT_234816 [Phyllosticta capitalensis]